MTLHGEYGNIALLLILYTLQGIPMGLSGFMTMEIKDIFKDSFSEMGTFSLATWPFSLKLLWAPIVDSVYSESFGRRKTWMVPAQIAIGIILLYMAQSVEGMVQARDVYSLTLVFFLLYLMCATQDIAVDGWALTMLRTENAGYASTCNSVGQTFGFAIGFMIPMAKLVSLPSFLMFWGTLFIGTTLAVWLLRSEEPTPTDEQIEGPQEAYSTALKVARCPPVMWLTLHLLTRSLTFIPADVMALGRLQDMGFPKEAIAKIKLVTTPLDLLLPWVLSGITAGPRPLSLVVWLYLPRTALTLIAGGFTMVLGNIPQPVPTVTYAAVAGLVVLQTCLSTTIFVAHMAFFARVSDPAVGGTYMTLLNTLHNLGSMWASNVCLSAADMIKERTGYDGFHVLCVACSVYGCIWFLLMRPALARLQDKPREEWLVVSQQPGAPGPGQKGQDAPRGGGAPDGSGDPKGSKTPGLPAAPGVPGDKRTQATEDHSRVQTPGARRAKAAEAGK